MIKQSLVTIQHLGSPDLIPNQEQIFLQTNIPFSDHMLFCTLISGCANSWIPAIFLYRLKQPGYEATLAKDSSVEVVLHFLQLTNNNRSGHERDRDLMVRVFHFIYLPVFNIYIFIYLSIILLIYLSPRLLMLTER